MILVILGILIIWCVASWFIDENENCDCVLFIFFGVIPLVIGVIATISLTAKVSNLNVIDQKVAMYEKENTKIEQQIETAVTAYQQHEKDVFTTVKPNSYMQLVSLYPELKSDTLVKAQIKTYQSNNKKIKELKEQAINGNVKRWWLYFGHKDIKY